MELSFFDSLKEDSFNSYPFFRGNSFSLSNRGNCDKFFKSEYDENIKITEFYNTATSYNMGHLINFFCTTLNNTCFITYHTCTPILSKEELNNFSNCMEKIIDTIIND
jgi:hypothetical protein